MLTRGDGLVLVLCGLLLPVLFLHYGVAATSGTQVRIRVGNKDSIQVPLNRDQVLRVQGKLGESVVEIKEGRVRFLHSPCSGKQCVHSGWAKRGGEFAACLPNEVSFTVLGQGAGGDYYDAINF